MIGSRFITFLACQSNGIRNQVKYIWPRTVVNSIDDDNIDRALTTNNASVAVCYKFVQPFPRQQNLTFFLHIYLFQHIEEKSFRKTLWKKVKLLKMSNFTFFHNVFYAICIFKSFNCHISVFVSSFFEFGTVSNCCIREWVSLFQVEIIFRLQIKCYSIR